MIARIVRVAILSVLVAGLAQAAGDVIREIQVKALDDFSADDGDVRAVIRAKIGDASVQANLSKDVDALLETKRFSSARVEVQPVADGVRVIYTVARRPVVYGDIELTGVDYFSNSKVEDWLELPQDTPVDDQILADRCNKVRREYLKRYFPKTEVTATMKPAASASRKGQVKVHVNVVEGPRLKPDEYVFEGNTNLESKDLRATFGEYPWWNPRGWFTTAPYNEDQLAKARQQAADAYLNQGYLDVKISDARFVPLPDDPKRAKVLFTVEEGGRYTVADLIVTGVKLFPETAVRGAITMLKAGDIASRKEIDHAAKAVKEYYTSRGYIDTAVNVSIKNKNVAEPTRATIVFDVQEGILVKVRKIELRGNTRTQDKVARREIQLNPGDVMDGVKIEQNENRIKNLGIFNKETVRHTIPNPPPGPNDYRDLIFDLEESRTGSFMIGGGFSSVDKLVGYIQLQQANFDILNYPNFTGAGQKARASMEIGANHQTYELGWTEPWFMDKPVALTVDLFYRERQYNEYTETDLGGDVGIKYPIKIAGVPFGAFGVKYTLDQINLRDQLTNQYYVVDSGKPYRFSDEPSSALNSALEASWEYDSRDQIFVPKRGTDATLFSAVSGEVLGGDNDIFHTGGSYKHWFNPWWDHVLSLRGRVETVSSYSDQPIPIFDRLFLGGGQTIRGVEYRDVGPKVVDSLSAPTEQHPIGGATLGMATAEYSIPIFEAVRIATFSDVGNVTPSDYDFSGLWKNYCWTYGAGLRIDIPGFPIRFDYAVPLKKDSPLTRDNHFIFWIGFE